MYKCQLCFSRALVYDNYIIMLVVCDLNLILFILNVLYWYFQLYRWVVSSRFLLLLLSLWLSCPLLFRYVRIPCLVILFWTEYKAHKSITIDIDINLNGVRWFIYKLVANMPNPPRVDIIRNPTEERLAQAPSQRY